MRVLPVPVTALSHTIEKDISTMALETTRRTGIAAWVNSGSWP